MENEEKAQLEAQHKEMNDIKGDIFRLTGLLEQILTYRLGEGTSTRPTVTAQLAPMQIPLFTSFHRFSGRLAPRWRPSSLYLFHFLSQHQL